ncbi:MAG TPA: hydrogenase maturation nickel metallochaperone HypA [Capsulimonadaceae bacterium]|jgi:hydrogenase nickel incorporation protein HypA/HybF
MHEVGLVQQALDIAFDYARRSGAETISLVRLSIGELSGVEPDAISFSFGVLTEGTMAAKAQLEMVNVPAVYSCNACEREFPLPDRLPVCPNCGGNSILEKEGFDLRVKSIEVT